MPYNAPAWANDVPPALNGSNMLDLSWAAAAGYSFYNVQHPTYGATGNGSTDDTAAVEAAIAAASAGDIVWFPRPSSSYKISSEVTLKPGVSLLAAPNTPITGGVGSGYVFKSMAADSTAFSDVVIDGFDFNVGSLAAAGIVRCEYATRVTVRNCRFRNINGGWGLLIGVTNGADTTIRNSDILIENCDFDTMTGTYEQLLLMNSQRVTVRKCRFYNVASGGNCLGLYQKLDGVLVDDCTFDATTGRNAYYSFSTNNCQFRNCRFLSGDIGISGAWESDNGAFSETLVRGLTVDGCQFLGGTTGLQLGAVRKALVSNCQFEEITDNALIVDDGNATAAQPDDIIIEGCQFRNNNNGASVHGYHPGIFFQSVGGSQHVQIVGNQFMDDQGTKTQRYPLSFSGAFTWDYLTVVGNRLYADTGGGGTSVGLFDSAVLGQNCIFANNTEHSGSNSVASAATLTLSPQFDYFTVSGTTTVTSVTASYAGRRVTLKFDGVLTFTDGSNLILNSNFTTSADDTITLVCNGTNWYEVARSAN